MSKNSSNFPFSGCFHLLWGSIDPLRTDWRENGVGAKMGSGYFSPGALAVIYGAGPTELTGVLARSMGWQEAYSFMLFTLLYTPCVATLAAIRKEARSLRFTLASTAWSLGIGWLVAFAFYQLAK